MVMVEVRSREELARLIDHTVIKPTTRLGDVVKVCKEALHYGFAAVCVPPTFVQTARGQGLRSPQGPGGRC